MSASGKYDKAIADLPELIKIGWQDGAPLLMEAYAGAGRTSDGIKWLEDSAPDNPELYGTLGDFYARERRWTDSANAYEQALENSPRSFDYRVFMASSLLQTDNIADVTKARDVLRDAVTIRGTDERALYLLSQAERRAGDASNAESAARRLIVQNGKNPRGYVALAEALEDQRRYQPIIDALAPAVTSFSGANDNGFSQSMLLPHLGFAYQELGQFDKAISTFETARKIAPNDPSVHALSDSGADGRQELQQRGRTRSRRPGDTAQRSPARAHGIARLATRREGRPGACDSRRHHAVPTATTLKRSSRSRRDTWTPIARRRR